jgi:hypothetical protein
MAQQNFVKPQDQKAASSGESKPVKLVKIRARRDCMIPGGQILKEGEEAEVAVEVARELCQKIDGGYGFSGERDKDDAQKSRHNLARAEIVMPEVASL